MNQVLSIEQSQRCTGQSVYVTKRLCISVVFAIGFLCILGGFLLGQMRRDSDKNQPLFKEVPNKVAALLKRAEGMSQDSVPTNSSDVHKFKDIFECISLSSDITIMHSDNIGEFLKQLLKLKEKEVTKSVEMAMKYLDTIS